MEELRKRGQLSTNIRASAQPQADAVFQQWMNDLREHGESNGSSRKQAARLESFWHRLNLPPYGCKAEALIHLAPAPNVVARFHHKMVELDL